MSEKARQMESAHRLETVLAALNETRCPFTVGTADVVSHRCALARGHQTPHEMVQVKDSQ